MGKANSELPWQVVYKAKDDPRTHVCEKPREGLDVGDIIECRRCKKRWEVERLEHGVQWDPIVPPALIWIEVTPALPEWNGQP